MDRINFTDLSDKCFNQIMDVAETRFAGYRHPVTWAALKWGMDKYRAQFLQREVRCWEALQAGETPPKGTDRWLIEAQTELLQQIDFYNEGR